MGAQFSDYEFGFRYGEREAMDHTSYKEGNFNIATDTGSLSLDIDGKRIELTDIITGYTELEIRAIPIPTAKVYLANDTFNLLVFDFVGGTWRIASSEVVLHAQRAEQDENGNNIVATYETKLDAESTATTLRGLISALQYRIDTINKFNIVFLNPGEGLPTEGEIFTIYFVPAENQSTLDDTSIGNNYVEYIWTGNEYEQIGLISTDLADYYKKSETYNKTEIDESFDELSYVENVTKSGNKVTVETNKNGTSNFEVGVMSISVGLGINTDNIIEDPDTGEEVDGKYINNTGTISLNFKNSSLTPIETGERLYIEGREYPVGLDTDGYLSVNVPWTDTNTDTHYTSKTVVSDSSENLYNAAAPNGYVYLNHMENDEIRSAHNIIGTGATTVTSDGDGKIIINSTNTNTTYNVVSKSEPGLCPRLPNDDQNNKYLRQDGGWVTPYELASDVKLGLVKLYDTSGFNTDGTFTQKYINDVYLAKQFGVTSVSISRGKLSVTKNGNIATTDINIANENDPGVIKLYTTSGHNVDGTINQDYITSTYLTDVGIASGILSVTKNGTTTETDIKATTSAFGLVKLYTSAGNNTDGSVTQKFINSTYLTKANGLTAVSISNCQLSVTKNGTTTNTDIELDFGDEDA